MRMWVLLMSLTVSLKVNGGQGVYNIRIPLDVVKQRKGREDNSRRLAATTNKQSRQTNKLFPFSDNIFSTSLPKKLSSIQFFCKGEIFLELRIGKQPSWSYNTYELSSNISLIYARFIWPLKLCWFLKLDVVHIKVIPYLYCLDTNLLLRTINMMTKSVSVITISMELPSHQITLFSCDYSSFNVGSKRGRTLDCLWNLTLRQSLQAFKYEYLQAYLIEAL